MVGSNKFMDLYKIESYSQIAGNLYSFDGNDVPKADVPTLSNAPTDHYKKDRHNDFFHFRERW